jgi:magnesium-transporting ATPase (P-type)
MKDLKVLARARPDHKHMVVAGLRQMGKRVLVTGDGVNDVDSVQCADVGFAMGSGCSAVKEVADVILVRDDFDATVKAVKWGRNIYHNVGRFLQFQMTVNLSVVLTVAIGSPILSESPFTAGQLLWINLIMDTFAAFALATEPPLDAILAGPPRGLDEDILTPAIWRQVFGVALWNVAVMLIMILLGPAIGGLEYGYSTSVLDTPATEASTNKTKHLTMVYNTFIFLQVFNEINCRKIGRRDFNVFEGIHGNLYFLAVVGGTFAAQFVLVHQYSGLLFPTVALAKGEWGACVAVGATPLAIAAALKLTPESWLGPVQRVRKIVDENAETAPSALVTAYEKAKKAKVTDFAPAKKKAGEADDDFHNV